MASRTITADELRGIANRVIQNGEFLLRSAEELAVVPSGSIEIVTTAKGNAWVDGLAVFTGGVVAEMTKLACSSVGSTRKDARRVKEGVIAKGTKTVRSYVDGDVEESGPGADRRNLRLS